MAIRLVCLARPPYSHIPAQTSTVNRYLFPTSRWERVAPAAAPAKQKPPRPNQGRRGLRGTTPVGRATTRVAAAHSFGALSGAPAASYWRTSVRRSPVECGIG
jgi:hypothetical protein